MKKARLKARAEAKISSKKEETPKKPNFIRSGSNTVTTLIEQKKAQLVVIAHDVDPIEVSFARSFSIFLYFILLHMMFEFLHLSAKNLNVFVQKMTLTPDTITVCALTYFIYRQQCMLMCSNFFILADCIIPACSVP